MFGLRGFNYQTNRTEVIKITIEDWVPEKLKNNIWT